MDCQRIGLLPREFDALDRHKILWLLVHCIAKLPPKPKKVLALYYHEDFSLADIATGLGLTENEIDQMRAKTLRVLQMMLTTQLSAALPHKGSAKKNHHGERVKGKSHFRRQKRSNRHSDEFTKQRGKADRISA